MKLSDVKAYIIECDYESALDGMVIIATSLEVAKKSLFNEVGEESYNEDDWNLKELEIEDGDIV